MHAPTHSNPGVAATGIAVLGIAAMAATPLAPETQAGSPPAVLHDVRLAATTVPPGGLLTSFLGNQVINCLAICGPLANIGVTAAETTLQTPVAFAAALPSGDLLKTIGITAASVTGPTNAALAAAIDADATVAVPKASNSFEVAVVGLLNIVPAVGGGLPAVGAAIDAARQQTFDALNLPVPVTESTAMPRGVVQVAAISAINVGEAVIFPAFNDVLQATVGVPNAAAQELAATGDPVRAAAAGATSAAGSVTAAATVVGNSVVKAVRDIRTAAGPSSMRSGTTQLQEPSTTATRARASVGTPRRSDPTPKHASAEPRSSHPLSDVASKVRDAARSVTKSASVRPHSTAKHRA